MQQQQSGLIVLIVALVLGPSSAIGRSSAALESADSVASALLAETQPTRLLAVLAIGQPDGVNGAADDNEEPSSTAAALGDSAAVSGHRRQRRQSSADYYSNYYNDYYNSYYNSLNRRPVAPAPAASANNYNRPDRFDGNANSIDGGNNGDGGGGFASDGRQQPQVINGQKYVYTPLFQYKATQGHHQKLFVPNQFG